MHIIIFRITLLSGELRISYTLDVILLLSVPVTNYLLWMSMVGITNDWLVFLFKVVSLIKCFVSSSSRSNYRQSSSIFCLRAFRNISLGLISKKNLILAFIPELYFSILRGVRFSPRVSRMELVDFILISILFERD